MGIEAVPVVGASDRVPCPVGFFRVDENDARFRKFLIGIGPDIEVALRRSRRRLARALEPGMLIGGVVDDELDDDADIALVGGVDEGSEILHRPIIGANIAVVGDVVAVVASRRRKERQKPDGIDAEGCDMIELLVQAGEVADPVAIGVVERLDVQLVDDRILVPERQRRAICIHRVHSCLP